MKRMGEAALTVVHENQGATERNIKLSSSWSRKPA